MNPGQVADASRSGEQECARCGARFFCGAATGTCWCQDLPPALAPVAGENCYCPACLKTLIALRESAR